MYPVLEYIPYIYGSRGVVIGVSIVSDRNMSIQTGHRDSGTRKSVTKWEASVTARITPDQLLRAAVVRVSCGRPKLLLSRAALIESRNPNPQPESLYKPSLFLVAQPKTLPGARGEIDVVQAVGSLVTTLVSEKATPSTVVAGLRDHLFVHFVCHGLLETGKPFDASFELHGGNLTLLQIV